MIEIIKELDVEVTKPNIFQALVAKQYDMNTRFLKVTLKDCGKRIDVPAIDTAKVVINAERKDGQSKGFDGVINEDGTVTVPLHSWMLELDGTVICDISVIDTATDDNKKLTTTSFTLLVEKAAYGGNDVTNDPQYDVLVSLLETCSEASVVAQEALDKSNEALVKSGECIDAVESAQAATAELESIKQELAEGGYIHSIKEKNHGYILSFWVGTSDEYKALEKPPENCYVIITDDMTIEEINNKIVEIQNVIERHTAKKVDLLADAVDGVIQHDVFEFDTFIVGFDNAGSTTKANFIFNYVQHDTTLSMPVAATCCPDGTTVYMICFQKSGNGYIAKLRVWPVGNTSQMDEEAPARLYGIKY